MTKLLKSDFPIFDNNPGLIYLDSASSTQKPQYVIDKTNEFIQSNYANIGRGSYSLAQRSDDLHFKTKDKVANLIHCKPNEIFFSHNATYCINSIALSLIASNLLKSGSEIILSIQEHHANILIRQHLAKQYNLTIKWLGIHKDGCLAIESLSSIISDKTALVCLSLCSNVLGIRNNLNEIRNIIGPSCLFLIDASQAVPNYEINVQELDCDFLVFSAHKFLAYTGVGVGFIKHELISKMNPGILGGGIVDDVTVEHFTLKNNIEKFESGTPNIIGIASLFHALDYRQSNGGYTTWQAHEEQLISHTLNRCLTMSDKLTCINTQEKNRIGIFSFVPNQTKRTLNEISEYLDSKKICVRVGGHCAHPLAKELGIINGSLRISLYSYNDKNDIDSFFDTLKEFL